MLFRRYTKKRIDSFRFKIYIFLGFIKNLTFLIIEGHGSC